jgi:hypothetical membrane protein
MGKSRLSDIFNYSFIAAGIVIVCISAVTDLNGTGTGLGLTVLGVFLMLLGIFRGRVLQLILDLISGLF